MSKNDPVFSGPFAPICEMFVAQKRILGIQYKGQIWILRRFDNLAKDFNIQNCAITKSLVEAWSEKSPNESNAYYATRMYVLWHFADFLVQQGYESCFFRYKLNRSSMHTPYIFTTTEMKKIFETLDNMQPSPCSPAKHLSYPVLYRVLYGCGLRISEALALTLQDVDIDRNILHVKNGKNGKERLVPMCESLTQHCSAFVNNLHGNHSKETPLFSSRDDRVYCVSNIEKHFRELLWNIDIPYCGKTLGPRLHDIRHTFVCHRLRQWVHDEVDLMTMLPVLSKYLGHENVAGTQWYLKLTAEAYPDITAKMEAFTGYVFPEAGGEYFDAL